MKIISVVIVSALLVLALSLDNCKPISKLDKIQSGIINIYNKINEAGSSQYKVNVQFEISQNGTQIAAVPLNLNEVNSKAGFDFGITVLTKNNENALFIQFVSKNNGWKKIDFSYLVSSRPDLIMGRFMTQDFKNANNNYLVIQTKIDATLDISATYKVMTFISGIKTSMNGLSINLKDQKIEIKLVRIQVIVSSQQLNLLQNLQITYVVWRNNNQFQFSELKSVPNDFLTNYSIVGFNGLEKDQTIIKGLSLHSKKIECVGKNCQKPCIIKSQCQGLIKKQKCFQCEKGQTVREDGNCINEINKCQQNEQLKNEKCECKTGWNRIKGVCAKCEKNSFFDTSRQDCVCNLGFFKSKNTCVQCHFSCGACRGAGDDKCVTCADNTFTFKDKKCVKKETADKRINLQNENNDSSKLQKVKAESIGGLKIEQKYLKAQPNLIEPAKVEPPKYEPIKVEPPKAEPVKAEPVRAEPPKAEPVKAEPVKAEPPKAEPPKAEPPKAEPPKAEPVKAEPPKAEPPKAEPVKAEPPKAEPPKAEPVKAEPPKAEPPKAEPVKAEPPRAEPVKAEPPKAEPVKAEPVKAEPPKAESVKADPPKAEPIKAEVPKSEPLKSEPPKAKPIQVQPSKLEPNGMIRLSQQKLEYQENEQLRKADNILPKLLPQDNSKSKNLKNSNQVFQLQKEKDKKPLSPMILSDPPQSGNSVQNNSEGSLQFSIYEGNSIIEDGTIMKGYILSNIPDSFQQDNIQKLLKIQITRSSIIPSIRMQNIEGYYSSKNKKILLIFDFSRSNPNPFNYVISINPQFKPLFSQSQQKFSLKQFIDPAVLIRREESKNLRLYFEESRQFQVFLSSEQEDFLFSN